MEKGSVARWITLVRTCQYDIVMEVLQKARSVPKRVLHEVVLMFRGVARIDLVTLLLEKYRIPVNECNNAGQTALMFACATDPCLDIVQFLVARGGSVNARDNAGATALIVECNKHRRFDVIKYLVEHGAELNAETKQHKRTALMHLLHHSEPHSDLLSIVRYFVEHGVNLNARSSAGASVSTMAARFSKHNIDVLRYLLTCGLSNNALVVATWYSSTTSCADAVRVFLNNGANVNIRDRENNTLLESVSTEPTCALEAIVLLVEAGALFDRSKVKKNIVHAAYLARYPVHHLCAVAARLRVELVQLTLDGEEARALLPKTDLFWGDDLPLHDILALPYRRVLEGVAHFLEVSRPFYDMEAMKEELACVERDLSNTLRALAVAAHRSTVVREELFAEEERAAKRGRK